MPLLVMVAGPNGSGKSTLISAMRSDRVVGPNLPRVYVNADDIQKEAGLDAGTAQRAATKMRGRALAERRDLMYETVMSHPSKVAELQQARAAGYEIHVYFLATENPSINVQRVGIRVAAGGHDVPEDRIRERYDRTLWLAPSALGLADHAFVYDNSDSKRGLQAQAQLVSHQLVLKAEDPAKWVQQLTGRFNDRAQELARLLEQGSESGVRVQAASLAASRTVGPVASLGTHYAIQRDQRNAALVIHDLALLPPMSVAAGKIVSITYADAVGSIQDASRKREP